MRKHVAASLLLAFVALVATARAGFQPPAFIDCTVPDPVTRTGGNSTRVCQPLWDGCVYYVRTGIVCDRMSVRFTQATLTPEVTFAFYQGSTSGYPLERIGTFVFTPTTTPQNYEVSPQGGGTVGIHEGPLFCLFGLTSATGAATLRTFAVQPNDLINLNMDVNYWPATFTSTVSVTGGATATLDPRTSPTGIGVPTSVLDVCPVIRFRKS